VIKQNLYKVLLFFLFFPFFIFPQKVDGVYFEQINYEARTLEENGSFSEAYILINDLISKLKKQNSPEYLVYSYQTKASIEQNLGKYKELVKTAKNALQISLTLKDSSDIAYNYNLVGIGYYFLSDYDSTKIYYEKSYNLKKRISTNSKGLAASAYNLAILYEDLAQREMALKFYKEAEFYLLELNEKKTFLSDVYVGLAHLYFFNKEIDKAEEYSEKAMDIGKKAYGEFNPNMTFVYNSYANILEKKEDYKGAISLLEKSLKIREQTYGKNHKWTCEGYYKLAWILMLDKQAEKAIKYYKHAIEIGKNIKSSQFLANAELFLAKLYIDENIQLHEAEKLILSALDKNIQVFGYKNDIIAEDYYYLALLAKNRKDKKKLFTFSTKSLNSANYNKNSLDEVIAPLQVLNVLTLLGDWYMDAYNETKNIQNVEDSFKLIDEEIALIKYIQKNFSSDQSKINFANEYRKVFEKGLNICWVLYHKNKDSKYLEKAFELSETNRATTLLEGVQDTKFKLYSGIPNELLEKEKKIKQTLDRIKLDLYYEQKAANPDKNIYSNLLDKRILYSKRLDSIHMVFEKDYPRYANLKYNNNVISISDVQNNLKRDTQLIIYFLGDKNLYSFTIINNHVTFLKGAVSEDLIEKTNLFKSELIARKDVFKVSHKLYQYLLKQQINPKKENLIIIPDNVLNYIPFEILQREENKYLIEDFTICYAGSVQLLLELKNNFFKYAPSKFWAGFSPDYADTNTISSSLIPVITEQTLHSKL
jgi:tetratricopeptide (TPR) repeat protein